MKQLTRNYILLFIGFFIINTHSFAEDTFENLQWQEGPKTQNILGIASFFLDINFVALNVDETDKYLKLTNNVPSGKSSFFGPNDSSWDGYFNFNEVGYVKDDKDFDTDELLKQARIDQKSANKYRREQGWEAFQIIGWEYPPNYDERSNRLQWAYLLEDESKNRFVNYETRILGRNGVMEVVLVSTPDNLNTAVNELNNILSSYNFNAGEKYSEYKQGDRVAEFGLAALIAGGVAAVASKKGLWAMLMGLLIAAKKFAFVIIIGLFAGIASLFKRKK